MEVVTSTGPTLGCREGFHGFLRSACPRTHPYLGEEPSEPQETCLDWGALWLSSDPHPVSSHQLLFQFQIFRVFHPSSFIEKVGGGHLGNDPRGSPLDQLSQDNGLQGRMYLRVVLSALSTLPEPVHPVPTSCSSSGYSVVR